MEEDIIVFTNQLEVALMAKQTWFNTDRLQKMLEEFRLLYTCVRNLNEVLIKRSLIQPDPYKLEARISEIAVIETSPFTENEDSIVLGKRFSDYEMMLDFICTYFRFSVENITVGRIKILMELIDAFDWGNLSSNSSKSNTRALSTALTKARTNAPAVTISLINDSQEKCAKCCKFIKSYLTELADFQKELYKGNLRKDLFEHPDFDKKKAFSSPEAEMAEIKRLYVKTTGKKTFYTDLVQEIIAEDQGGDRQNLRQKLLSKLEIKIQESKKETKTVDPHDLLMAAVFSLGVLGSVLGQIGVKLSDNFDLLFYVRKTFFVKFMEALKKALGIKEKERYCTVLVTDPQSGAKSSQQVQVGALLSQISRLAHIYSGIAAKGNEYNKLNSAKEDDALIFLNKQVQENQRLFTIINALDEHFKSHVEVMQRPKVRGLKIDLSSYRNAIIAINKKRGEYASAKEEIEQMRKLGIVNN
ncbi:MAG: hypothetical protein IKR64_02290 [Treponema sp.]|nr:hypothetical protein [Treponema sp.]